MKNHTIISAITIAANIVIGVTENQLSVRAHNLDVLDEQDLPEGIVRCTTKNPVQFKAGEELWIDSLPKTMASQVKESKEEPGEVNTGDVVIEEMTSPKLKEYLTTNNVDFEKSDNKPRLLELALEYASSL